MTRCKHRNIWRGSILVISLIIPINKKTESTEQEPKAPAIYWLDVSHESFSHLGNVQAQIVSSNSLPIPVFFRSTRERIMNQLVVGNGCGRKSVSRT